MRKPALRRGAGRAAVVAAALTLSLGLPAGSGGTAPALAESASAQAGAPPAAIPFPHPYLSPWSDAEVRLGAETLQWLTDQHITLEAVSPFKMDADGRGFSMPAGTTAYDGLDARGRIYYPGGLRFQHAASHTTIVLKPTYLRVMPRPGWTSAVEVNGKVLSREVAIGDTRSDDVLAGARPSATGLRVERALFYLTPDAARLFEEQTGRPGPRPGSLFGALTPSFDHVPGARRNPAPPRP